MTVYELHVQIDNVPLPIFSMNEGDYVIKLIFAYGTNEQVSKDKFRTICGYIITFKYPETVHNHYQHIDSVGFHYSRRQAPIVMEETCPTRHW